MYPWITLIDNGVRLLWFAYFLVKSFVLSVYNVRWLYCYDFPSWNTATYKYCCRGSYCPGCPVEVYFTFDEQKRLVHAGLKLDCKEHSFNTTVDTVLQDGIYAINVSPTKINHNNATYLSLIDFFAKRNLWKIFVVMFYADVYLLLYFIYLCLRSYTSRKNQCHIYPRLTGRLVKLTSKVRYISEKALGMAKISYIASILQPLSPPLFWLPLVTCIAGSSVYLFTQPSQSTNFKYIAQNISKFTEAINGTVILHQKYTANFAFRTKLFRLKIFS